MATTRQLQAVTGRRSLPSSEVAKINAQVPFLPELFRRRSESEFQDRLFDLNERQLEEDIAFQNQNLALRRKQGRTANIIAAGTLGANVFFSRRGNQAAESIFGGGDAVSGVSAVAQPKGFFDTSSTFGKLKVAGLGGLAGTFLGPSIGKAIGIGGEAEQRAIGGAVVGGLTSGLTSNFDLFSTIGGAVLGAAGGVSFSKAGLI